MSGPEYIDCEQGTDAWLRARLGLVTMSKAGTILAKGKDGKSPSLTRATYMRELCAEIITGEPTESYTNGHMERGKRQEADARRLYAFAHDVEPRLVGFVRRDDLKAGCSPDSMLDPDGIIEIKTRLPHLQVELVLADQFPPEHKAQVQGNLWITEREFCDLIVYSPGLPLYVSRMYRDEDFITKLSAGVRQFNVELAKMVDQVRRFGMPAADRLRLQLEESAA